MQSESINELASALSKAQGEFDHAKKDVNNAFFKSKYADLASCIDAARVQLSKHGLSVVQVTSMDNGSMMLETRLLHSSGQWIGGIYPINPVKNDPQGLGSAITYARRYCFCAITGIASDDDDGNAASGNQSKVSEPVEEKPWFNGFDKFKEKMLEEIQTGEKTASDILDNLRLKYRVSKEIEQKIKELEL